MDKKMIKLEKVTSEIAGGKVRNQVLAPAITLLKPI